MSLSYSCEVAFEGGRYIVVPGRAIDVLDEIRRKAGAWDRASKALMFIEFELNSDPDQIAWVRLDAITAVREYVPIKAV